MWLNLLLPGQRLKRALTKSVAENSRLYAELRHKETEIIKLRYELSQAKAKADHPPVFHKGQKIGGIHILEVTTTDSDAALLIGLGFVFLFAAALHYPLNRMSASKEPQHKYRIYDEGSSAEKTVTEAELRDIVSKKSAVTI